MNAPPLPPIGQITEDTHGNVVTYLQGLVFEATQDGRDDWIAVADSCLTIFTFGADPAPSADSTRIVVNEIQNAVVAVTDIQTKEPPSVNLEPVEKGEPPVCYWAGPQDAGITLFGLDASQVAANLGPDGQLQPPLPLSEQQADVIRAAVQRGGAPVPNAPPVAGQAQGLDGQPVATLQPQMAPIKPDWFVEVNDQLVADTYQTAFDVLWDRSRMDQEVRDNLLQTNIEGWSTPLYGFDDDAKEHLLTDMSLRQVYLDPTQSDIRKMQYAGIDLALDARRAVRMYPEFALAIEAEAQTGMLRRVDQNTQFGDAFDRTFRRDMIVMRVFWLRNQDCPYDPQDALARGLVEQREVPVAGVQPQPEENDDDAFGSGLPGVEEGDQEQSANEAGAGRPSPDVAKRGGDMPVAGDSGEAGMPAPVATRPGLFLPGSDDEVDPAHPQWPTYACLRQLTQIGQVIVDDRVCEFWDIPLLHNVNIPIPHRPWGIGEPFRLRQIQDANSRVINAMVENAEFFRAPTATMSRSMFEMYKEQYKDANIKPGRIFVMEDIDFQNMNGQAMVFQNPPPMPDTLVIAQPILKNMISELSGNAEVLQGRAQPQVKSGKAIELLQSAASGMVGFKSQRTGDFVYRLARLMLHSITWRMTTADLFQIVSKYPMHVLDAIHQRGRATEWDVAVTVSSGNGAVQNQKIQQAAQFMQIVDPRTGEPAMDLKTFRETAGLDDRTITQRLNQPPAPGVMSGPPAQQVPHPQQQQQRGPANPPPQPAQPAVPGQPVPQLAG